MRNLDELRSVAQVSGVLTHYKLASNGRMAAANCPFQYIGTQHALLTCQGTLGSCSEARVDVCF